MTLLLNEDESLSVRAFKQPDGVVLSIVDVLGMAVVELTPAQTHQLIIELNHALNEIERMRREHPA